MMLKTNKQDPSIDPGALRKCKIEEKGLRKLWLIDGFNKIHKQHGRVSTFSGLA